MCTYTSLPNHQVVLRQSRAKLGFLVAAFFFLPALIFHLRFRQRQLQDKNGEAMIPICPPLYVLILLSVWCVGVGSSIIIFSRFRVAADPEELEYRQFWRTSTIDMSKVQAVYIHQSESRRWTMGRKRMFSKIWLLLEDGQELRLPQQENSFYVDLIAFLELLFPKTLERGMDSAKFEKSNYQTLQRQILAAESKNAAEV